MKIIGIITEYNPFHNGHAYQIKKVKEELQADFVVVAMSGDFVQRGTPAIINKYARANMALSCGADLVIELPVLWSTASAEYFAMAGVTLFDKMGCIDGICFGAETDNLSVLSTIADILTCEPEGYRAALTSYLKDGIAFPLARSKALCDYFSNTTEICTGSHSNDVITCETISSILNTPNNILAIEYLKALKRRNSSITPYVIKREGAGYHDAQISPSKADLAPTASATAIRKVLDSLSVPDQIDLFAELADAMPASALAILKAYQSEKSLVTANDFSSILGYRLLTSDSNSLADIGDSNPDISNRIIKNNMSFTSFEQFCELNKSKDITYSRISRILLHLILNIKNSDYIFGKELDYIPYLRILGFRKDASMLLKELKSHSTVPVISKLADAASQLNTEALSILEKDVFAANLYEQICAGKSDTVPVSDYSQNMIRL